MKFLFILLIPFLVSINSVSDKTEKKDRIKCCSVDAQVKPKYLEGNYIFSKTYTVNMSFRYNIQTKIYTRKDIIEYTLVAEEGDNIKLITQVRDENLDNLLVLFRDSRRNLIETQTRKIDEKRTELKTSIPKKGIYYLSFIRKDTTDTDEICGASMFFLKKGKVEQKSTNNEEKIYQK